MMKEGNASMMTSCQREQTQCGYLRSTDKESEIGGPNQFSCFLQLGFMRGVFP